jgi:hypothetical protein
MRSYLATTGLLFALLGTAHWWRTFAEWPRLTDEPLFIVEGPGIGALASALAIWAWRLQRSIAGRPGG